MSVSVPLAPPAPVYLVHGAEDLLRGEALAAITGAVRAPGLEAFNEDRFEGGPGVMADVLAAARTLPVMAERRLVVVRGADRLDAGGLAALAGYLEDTCPTTTLVLEAVKVDLRRTPFPRIKQKGHVVACQPLSERKAAEWLTGRARALGLALERPAAALLAAYAGTALSVLASELDKAAAYAGEGARIDLKVVSRTVGGGRTASVFELTDALGARDAPGALRALVTLLDAGEPPLRVQSMIVRHFRLLWRTREHAGERDLARALGVHPFVADKLRAQARGHDDASMRAAFVRFAKVDSDLKGGAVSERRTLEDEVLALCA